MSLNELKQKAYTLASQIAEEEEVELFDINILGTKKLLLRVFIDKEGGVTIDDCERFSKRLGAILDIEDLFPGPYNLEVSSPGIDRPLKNVKDFEKNTGKLVRIVTVEKIENQNFFIGRILDVRDNVIKLSINKREIRIPYTAISKAKLEIEL